MYQLSQPNRVCRVDYDAFDRVLQRYMPSPSSAYRSARQLCDELDWEFRVYPRKGIEDSLSTKSNWRESQYVIT